MGEKRRRARGGNKKNLKNSSQHENKTGWHITEDENDYYLGSLDNKNIILHVICELVEKMNFGFHIASHQQTQRNGLNFHNYSLVKSRLVKYANEYVCKSHSTKYPHNNNKSLTSAIIFEKLTDANPMVFGGGEEMFENSNYNTAAQNLNEIEVTRQTTTTKCLQLSG